MPKKKPFIFNPHDNLLRTGVSESTNIDISMDGLGNLMKQYGRMPHINDPLYSRLAKDSFKQIPISATPINRDLYDTEFNKKWVNSKMFNDLALASKQNNSYTEAMRKQGNKDHPIFMTTDSRLIGNMDYQNPEMKALAINPSGIKNLQDGAYLDPSNDHINSTITHELSHAVDGDGKYISPQSQSLMQASLLPNPALSDTRYKYLSTPTEIRARLNTLRYESQNDKSFDVFNTPFKKNNLEKLKNSQSYRELRAIYDDTSILKLLNSVAKNDNNHIPMARNGINYNRAVLGADVLGLGTNSFKNGGGNDEWEVIDDTKVKFGNGGKDDFYNSLLQGPKPITDKGNFSNIQYTQSQSNTLQNVKKAQYKIAKTQLQDEQRARAVKEKNAPYAFPDGNTKTWEQMSDHEKGFINAQSLRNKGRWNENEVNQPFLNMFNPVTMLYDMAAGIGDAGYQSEQQNSVLPYVTGVGAPLLTGALAGLGTQSSGQFVNNLANPFAGIGNPMKKSNIQNSQSAIYFESLSPHVRNLEQLAKQYPNAAIQKKVISPTTASIMEAHDKIKNETLDILEHWVYEDPLQIKQYQNRLGQIEKIEKKRDLIKNHTITLSNKRAIESIDHRLDILDKHLKGLPTGEDEAYMRHLLQKNEDPNFRLGLEQKKQKHINDLEEFGDEYLWAHNRNKNQTWSSQQEWDFSNNLQAKKDALDLQRNTLLDQNPQPKLNSQFEEKIQNLYLDAQEAKFANTADPFTNRSFRDRVKVVYPENRESLNQLNLGDQQYVKDNIENISGARTADNTITLGSSPSHKSFELGYPIEERMDFDFFNPKTWNGQTKKVKSTTPSIITENQHFYNVSDNSVANTIAHETGHDIQKFGNWSELIDNYNPDLQYFTTHGNNPLSKQFQDALIIPAAPVNGRMSHNTWLSSGKELHSDLMAERVKMIKDLHSDPKTAVGKFRQNEDQMNEMILNRGSLNRFFKPGTSDETKKKLLRMLPVAIPAIGAGMALQEKQNGGLSDEWEIIE